MNSQLKRLRRETEDQLVFHPAVRRLYTHYRLFRDSVDPRRNDQEIARSISGLCSAARLDPSDQKRFEIEKTIRERVQQLDESKLDWSEFVQKPEDTRVGKAVILKPNMGPKEKGVVLISFEKLWVKLLRHGNFREFADRYTLVVAPSWTPPHCLVNVLFPEVFPDPIFTLISTNADMQTFPRLSDKYIPVPLLASNWVDPSVYNPLPFKKRDIDLLMVATFGKYKRHHVLFKALQKMPRDLRVLLIGTDHNGWNAQTIREQARWYGVEDRLVQVGSADYEDVAKAFSRSKVSLILSHREGSCVAVTESIFANTPVGVLDHTEIGSRRFINESTGRFLDERNLSQELMEMLVDADKFTPRAWADANGISCFESTDLLNQTIKEHALENGQEWTKDIAVHSWSPYPGLVFDEDKTTLAPAYQDIQERFGLVIGNDPFQSDKSISKTLQELNAVAS